MRKKMKFHKSENILGHTCEIVQGDQKFVLVSHSETPVLAQKARVKSGYYWFRAPRITLEQLEITAQNLAHMEHKFEFDIWMHTQDPYNPQFDASLKISDPTDAATFVWAHTEMWIKWDSEQEKSLLSQHKPVKVGKNKDGSVCVTVTVSTLED